MPPSPLASLHTVPLRRALSEGLALSSPGTDARCVLRLRKGRNRRCRNRISSAPVLRRLTCDTLAGRRSGIYGLRRSVQNAAGNRFERSALCGRSSGVDRSLDYTSTQALADAARSAGIAVIRYESARDPLGGHNFALLTCRTFAAGEPLARQTWRMRLNPSGVHAICEFPDLRLSFGRQTFCRDPRIAALQWQR